MDKPLSLNSLTFSDDKGNRIVTEDYFITFRNDDAMEAFIQDRWDYWKRTLDMGLLFAQDSCETLDELNIRKTVRLVAKYFKVDYKGAISRSRKHEYIEVRRMAIAICLSRHTLLTTVGKAMNMHHATVIHHRDTFKNLCETDDKYKQDFDLVENYVGTQMKMG